MYGPKHDLCAMITIDVCPVPIRLDARDLKPAALPILVEDATHIEPSWTSPEETN